MRNGDDESQPADPDTAAFPLIWDAVIIIFGAAVWPDGSPSPTLRHRVEAAARFGQSFRRPLFIPTGAKGRYGDAEAVVMARLLKQEGFADNAILLEQTATDTLSSVRAVAQLEQVRATMRRAQSHAAEGAEQNRTLVYACTSAYHLPRCLVLLRLAGIRARACSPPPVPAGTSPWLRWYWRLRETPAIPYDVLLILWLRAAGRL